MSENTTPIDLKPGDEDEAAEYQIIKIGTHAIAAKQMMMQHPMASSSHGN
jgi:hypothetical protein